MVFDVGFWFKCLVKGNHFTSFFKFYLELGSYNIIFAFMKESIEEALHTYYQIVKKRPEHLKEFSNKEINVYNFI